MQKLNKSMASCLRGWQARWAFKKKLFIILIFRTFKEKQREDSLGKGKCSLSKTKYLCRENWKISPGLKMSIVNRQTCNTRKEDQVTASPRLRQS